MQEFPQRVFGIFEEQTVVAKRRHGNGDLSKVVEILQHRTLQKNHQTQETSQRGEGGMGEAFTRGNQGSGQCLWEPPVTPSSTTPGPPGPPSTFTSLLHQGPSLPGTALLPTKRSLLAPDWRHSSLQEGHLQGPGLTPSYVLSCPPPGADPNRSVLEMPHFCCFEL